jgi:hypothetical protein
MSQSQASSNARDIAREHVAPKVWNSHEIAYLSDTDEELFSRFLETHHDLRSSVSLSTFKKYKPYWMRRNKWLTCKCPKCHEIEQFLDSYKRKHKQWHELKLDSGECTCANNNPLHEFSGGKDELFELAVCAHARTFSGESSLLCAHG